MNKHGVDVAKGHLALLEASNSDDFLQMSVLLEGRTIEFLYGPHGLARAMVAKSDGGCGSISSRQRSSLYRVIQCNCQISQYGGWM